LGPAVPALPLGQLHPEDAPPPFVVDADPDQHCPALDRPMLADAFVPRIDDHVSVRFLELSLGERFELVIQLLGDLTDRAGAE